MSVFRSDDEPTDRRGLRRPRPQASPSRSAARGWYPDPEQPTQLRYWDGDEWTDERALRTVGAAPVPTRRLTGGEPNGYIALGVVLSLVGGAVFGASLSEGGGLAFVAWVLLVAGCVNLGIGIIARGVQIGLREHQRDFE